MCVGGGGVRQFEGKAKGCFRVGQSPSLISYRLTSDANLGVLSEAGVRISMDGRCRGIDRRFIGRLWRWLRCEAVYLEELTGGRRVRWVIRSWLGHYKHWRPHLALGGQTPTEKYFESRSANPGAVAA